MKNALEIRGLTRKYEGFALDSVNLTLPRGCVMGLVGENGAGKTTLIKTVLDLVRPDSGEIEVLGGRADDAAVRERIGAVLEDGGFLSTMNAAQVDTLWDEVQRFDNPHTYYVDLSQKLWDIKDRLLHEGGRLDR